MPAISSAARSRIQKLGRETRRIRQSGIPIDVPLGVPIANPFAEKQLLFKGSYRLSGITLEDVREGLLFASYRDFMDIKSESFSRRARTRELVFNPFKKKLEEVLGGIFGKLGIRVAGAVADFMVGLLGLIEWRLSEEPAPDPDAASIHVAVKSKLFGGHFRFRIHREPDGVVLDDDWLPEAGANLRAGSLAMANLVLGTHPLGFEQIAERVVEEILQAHAQGRPYAGEIGPPSVDLDRAPQT